MFENEKNTIWDLSTFKKAEGVIPFTPSIEGAYAALLSLGQVCGSLVTGYSLSEALIIASINPIYEDRLFIELQVQ